jgi:hypothetical protein
MSSAQSVSDQQWIDKHMPSDTMFTDPRWVETTINGLKMNVWRPDSLPARVPAPIYPLWVRRAAYLGAMLISFAVTLLPLLVL